MTLNFYAEKTISSDKQQKRPKRTDKVESSDQKQFVGPTKICPAMKSWTITDTKTILIIDDDFNILEACSIVIEWVECVRPTWLVPNRQLDS